MRAAKTMNLDSDIIPAIEKYMNKEKITNESDAFCLLLRAQLIQLGFIKGNEGSK